jgi:hypothetical protein
MATRVIMWHNHEVNELVIGKKEMYTINQRLQFVLLEIISSLAVQLTSMGKQSICVRWSPGRV